MKTAASRYIDVTKEKRGKMAKAFSCTERAIVKALTYGSESEQAIKIRYTAIKEYGGTPMMHVPACETLHDTTEDGREVMRQEFDNGMKLVADKRTGEAWIYNRRGEVVEHRDRIEKLSELYELQAKAENI